MVQCTLQLVKNYPIPDRPRDRGCIIARCHSTSVAVKTLEARLQSTGVVSLNTLGREPDAAHSKATRRSITAQDRHHVAAMQNF